MKIKNSFDSLKQREEAALVVYYTAGFPTMEESMENVCLFAEYGADLIEIGVPFSDPIADGPTIQRASQVALENGVNLKSILSEVKKIRVKTPLVLMSYLNPLLRYGKEKLYADAKEAGISGFIVPDLPVDESNDWIRLSLEWDIDLVFLLAPTSSDERIRLVAKYTRGFIYCVSVTGTTGMRQGISSELFGFVKRIRSITDTPVAVGFGISTLEQIKTLRETVDGVIVGSRIIEAVKQGEDLRGIIGEFKAATKANRGESNP